MLNMGPVGVIIVIVVALLNIILFFKVWGMTSNTHKIKLFLEAQRPDLKWHENREEYVSRDQNKKD